MYQKLALAWLPLFALLPASGATCESLRSLTVPQVRITLAEAVSTPFKPPLAARPLSALPPFCRVVARIAPTPDSDIGIEVWIPLNGWSGRFQGVGNGGWAGTISYAALADALKRGYAAASTDAGHTGPAASFLVGRPEKVMDFGYRAVHQMTVAAKAIIATFDGQVPRYSYWNGCSTGGRQALMEAQRYPADYDGIIAGAPANDWTHLQAGSLWVNLAVNRSPESYIPPAKYPLIHNAVLAACDAIDGVRDGVLEDPRLCHFDPKSLQCEAQDGPGCLTAPQVEAARKIYSPVINPRTGAAINPGLQPGSELGWAGLAGPQPHPTPLDEYRYRVFGNPDWEVRTLDFDHDVARADRLDGGIVNATNPNLREFAARGGKMIMYQGWADQLVAPENAIWYYDAVRYAIGSPESSVRLFMAPGMAHCRGGEGPSDFDAVANLERWVETGAAPDSIVAAKREAGKIVRTRPLCPYPQVARYKGAGSTDDAQNFFCAAP